MTHDVNENANAKATRPTAFTRISMTVTQQDGMWEWVFSGDPNVVKDSSGEIDFTGFLDAVDVEIVIVDSPKVHFLHKADLCVAFDKLACPATSEKKDKDVFKKLSVSGNGDVLSFLNKNKRDRFHYALFVMADGKQISHDPIIINKNR